MATPLILVPGFPIHIPMPRCTEGGTSGPAGLMLLVVLVAGIVRVSGCPTTATACPRTTTSTLASLLGKAKLDLVVPEVAVVPAVIRAVAPGHIAEGPEVIRGPPDQGGAEVEQGKFMYETGLCP